MSKGKTKNSLNALLKIAENNKKSTGGNKNGSIKRKRSSFISPVKRKQLKIVTYAATPPFIKNLAYSIGHYKLYNFKSYNINISAVEKYTNFDIYDLYFLFFNFTISVNNFIARVFTKGVRLNNLLIAIAF